MFSHLGVPFVVESQHLQHEAVVTAFKLRSFAADTALMFVLYKSDCLVVWACLLSNNVLVFAFEFEEQFLDTT